MPKALVENKESALSAPRFNDPDAAREWLEGQRWPDGEPVCPHCGSPDKVYRINKNKAGRKVLYCGVCEKQFSVTVGTIFEDSKVPLHKWLQAFYLLCSSKKGMSAHQLHRTLGVTYKTAWFMAHRIRESMRTDDGTAPMMGGNGSVVEADETYTGPSRHRRFQRGKRDRSKMFSLVERDGNVRSFQIANVTAKTIRPIIKQHVARDTRIMTDEHGAYMGLRKQFKSHESVGHGRGEYARGDVTTNTVEGYFSILKRGLIGTYQCVSEQHLNKYVSEFDFRYNTRHLEDADRMNAALRQTEGRRLFYRIDN